MTLIDQYRELLQLRIRVIEAELAYLGKPAVDAALGSCDGSPRSQQGSGPRRDGKSQS